MYNILHFTLTALLGSFKELSSMFSNMLALCCHSTLAYYAFYYAGIFDADL